MGFGDDRLGGQSLKRARSPPKTPKSISPSPAPSKCPSPPVGVAIDQVSQSFPCMHGAMEDGNTKCDAVLLMDKASSPFGVPSSSVNAPTLSEKFVPGPVLDVVGRGGQADTSFVIRGGRDRNQVKKGSLLLLWTSKGMQASICAVSVVPSAKGVDSGEGLRSYSILNPPGEKIQSIGEASPKEGQVMGGELLGSPQVMTSFSNRIDVDSPIQAP